MAAHQAPPSLGFSRQEHWCGLPFLSPMHESEKWKWSCSVVSNSSRSHGLQPTRLLHPWDFPGKSTGVGCHCLLSILHIYTSDYKDRIMGRHTQQSLLSENLQLSVGLKYMPIYTPFLDWWWVQTLFCTRHNQKESTGSIKSGESRRIGGRLLCCWSASMSWECLCSKRSVCLCWIEL